MKLNSLKVRSIISLPGMRMIILLGFTFLTWWSGIAGRDIYALPASIFTFYCLFLILKNRFLDECQGAADLINHFVQQSINRKIIVSLFLFQSLVWVLVIVARYFSFHIWTWDAGLHSNILYNISNGDFFSSFLNSHNLADHFTPSFSFIALFYKLTPHILWMMGWKLIAYLVTPVIFYQICDYEFEDKNTSISISFIIIFYWLFIYAPIVNSMRYEFQASCLTPPLIAYAFLQYRKQHWARFLITMVFLLGFKEHLGSVWIGFGGFLILNKKPKTGIVITLVGIISIYLIMFQIMPYFRNYQASWSGVERIAPFKDLDLKVWYLVKLLLPFLFIPLIYFKNGILAAPAIGINLISGTDTMYSAHYHYDDVSSTMLFIALIASLKAINLKRLYSWFSNRKSQGVFLVGLVLFFHFLPESTFRFLKKAIPSEIDFEISQEIEKFDQESVGKRLAVQDVLGPRFNRKEIQVFIESEELNCVDHNSKFNVTLPIDYIVLSEQVSTYQIQNIKKCLNELEHSEKYKKLENYHYLAIFKRINKLN